MWEIRPYLLSICRQDQPVWSSVRIQSNINCRNTEKSVSWVIKVYSDHFKQSYGISHIFFKEVWCWTYLHIDSSCLPLRKEERRLFHKQTFIIIQLQHWTCKVNNHSLQKNYWPSAYSLFSISWQRSMNLEMAFLTVPMQLSEWTATFDHSLVDGSLLRDGKL